MREKETYTCLCVDLIVPCILKADRINEFLFIMYTFVHMYVCMCSQISLFFPNFSSNQQRSSMSCRSNILFKVQILKKNIYGVSSSLLQGYLFLRNIDNWSRIVLFIKTRHWIIFFY